MRELRRFIVGGLCAIAIAAAAAVSSHAAENFLSAIEDLPLMPGLVEVAGSATVFSKPGGRIVEIAARGPVERARVLAFYARTLPQLGWRSRGAAMWEREAERLSIAFEQSGKELTVQFSLSPK